MKYYIFFLDNKIEKKNQQLFQLLTEILGEKCNLISLNISGLDIGNYKINIFNFLPKNQKVKKFF